MGWERRYQGAAQHLAALYKSRLFSPLQLGYAEEGQSVTGEQRTHTSRAQLPKASKGSGPGYREEGRDRDDKGKQHASF